MKASLIALTIALGVAIGLIIDVYEWGIPTVGAGAWLIATGLLYAAPWYVILRVASLARDVFRQQ